MTSAWQRLIDPKGWAWRRAARAQIKEAKRLLARSKGSLSPESEGAVRAAASAVEDGLRNADAEATERARVKLAGLVDKHLVGFRKPAWLESIESVGFAVAVALVLRAFVFEAFKIPSGSMIPTLAIGDQIFVNKYIYGPRVPFTPIRLMEFAAPKRGEVIVFICPVEPHEDYIKRVIGLPGDEVEVRDGIVYVNREPIDRTPKGDASFFDRDSTGENWRAFSAKTYQEKLGEHTFTIIQDADLSRRAADYAPHVVPPNHVLVMGDNRDHSYDSRFWGMVPMQNILGRSTFVWWSWGRDNLDAKRIGTWID